MNNSHTNIATSLLNSGIPPQHVLFQSTSDKDIIVHLAPTPVPDEGDLSSEEEEAVPSLKQEPNRPKYPDSLPKVVETTVSQHARQVRGGQMFILVCLRLVEHSFKSSR